MAVKKKEQVVDSVLEKSLNARLLVVSEKVVPELFIVSALLAKHGCSNCTVLTAVMTLVESEKVDIQNTIKKADAVCDDINIEKLEDISNNDYDIIIALSDTVADKCILFPGNPHLLTWQFDSTQGKVNEIKSIVQN